jgi:arsenical-resistance protein 2
MSSGAVSSNLSAGELRARFLEGQQPGRHFILIDLRGSDFEGGTIKGSLNIPLSSLPSAIPTLLSLCLSAGISDVIFFCG